MLKKDIIFGSVVLLLAALFALTGCSQATNSDGGTVYSENHLWGTADENDVARAVASAKATGRSVVLTDGSRLTGSGTGLRAVASFDDLPVRVEGAVTVIGDVIVNAAFANLTFAEGATITVGDGTTGTNPAFIYRGDDTNIGTDSANIGRKVKYVTDPLYGTQGTDLHVAVLNYPVEADYSNIASHIDYLYVIDKLTVSAASALPGNHAVTGNGGDAAVASDAVVVALGTIDYTGNNPGFFADLVDFEFTAKAVLTSSIPNLTVTVPDAAELPTVKVATPLTIEGPGGGTGIATSLTIAKIEGTDTLTITDVDTIVGLKIGTVDKDAKVVVNTQVVDTSFDIESNAGSVSVVTPDFGAALTVVNNSGSLSVSAATTFDGPVEIGDNSGDISLTAPNATGFTGGLVMPTSTPAGSGRNSGTITITTPLIATAPIGIRTNSGTLNFAADDVTDVITVSINTKDGVVNFTKELAGTLADNFITSPNNDGTISFWGALTIPASTAFGSATSADSISGSGKVIFGDEVTTDSGITIIGTNTEFNGPVSIGTGNLVLGGNVTLGYGQSFTFGGTLTLAANRTLSVDVNPVLIAGSNSATITGTGAVLEAGAARTTDSGDDYTGDRTLTLLTAKITDITGDLRVAPNGVLQVGVDDGIDVGSGSLTLEDGARLSLANGTVITGTANTGDDYTVTFGATVIAGENDAESLFAASGGPVTFSANRISGSGTLSILEESEATPTITVSSASGGTFLTIAGVNLDLQNGSLVIPGNTSGADGVRLSPAAKPGDPFGKITLAEETEFSITTGGRKLNDGTNAAAITGSGTIRAGSDTLPTTIGEIAADKSGTVTITGTTTSPNGDVTIDSLVQVTN